MLKSNQDGQSVSLLVILSLIWGTSFILIKKGLVAFTPDVVAALRVSAASLILIPAAISLRHEVNQKDLLKLFASGIMGIFVPAFLFAFAQRHMDSSVAGILNTLTPLFTMLIGAQIFKQRFTPLAIVGILLGLSGAIILSISRNGSLGAFNAWSLLIVVACFFYGANLNFIKFKIQGLRALTITSVSLILISPLALGYLFLVSDFIPQLQTHPEGYVSLLYIVVLGIMSTAVATILFNRLVKISTPLFASSVTYLMPVVAVMWGFLDHEKLSWGHLVGLIAILTGVYLANKRRPA